MYLVGIDVGTTNTKTVIFDVETGQVRSVGSSRTLMRHPQVDWSEFDAGDLWNTVVQSMSDAIRQCDRPEQIRAIAVASMGEAAFPLDAAGNILYPAIAWYDLRSSLEAQWWSETFGQETIYNITGQNPHPMFGINKLLWLRHHEPELFRRIHRWLSIEDFVLWKLSGSIATDYSIASRTMAFDQRTRSWSESILKHADLPGEWFPPALPGGTSIGKIQKEVAKETGLPLHTEVCTGGHDHLCGAFAAGVTRPGHLLDSTGTASAILALNESFQPGNELLAAGFTSYAYVLPNAYVTLGSLSFAGGALEWIVKLLYGHGKQDMVTDAIYQQALHEGGEVAPGARGALLFPYYLGTGTPHGQNSALAALVGLTPSHSRAEIVRALMEGLGFWLRDNLVALERLGITPSHPEIIAVGGTTQATELMQIKAEITGCPIHVLQIKEAAATGAALLAGLGVHIFHSGDEAASSVRCTIATYEPQPQQTETYNAIYQESYLPMRRSIIGK